MRLAIVVSHPTQYYSPWFSFLEANYDWKLKVYYLWKFGVQESHDPLFQRAFKWDIDLLSGHDHEFVTNTASHPGTHKFGGLNNPALVEKIRQYQPTHVLLFGYRYISHLRLILASRGAPWKLLFRGDSHFLGRPEPRGIKRFMLNLVYRQFARILYVGLANRAYFQALGVGTERLIFAPHAVDATRFSQRPPDARISDVKRQFGISPDHKVILFCGKLHHEKAPETLLEAFIKMARSDCTLVFSGSGPEEESLKRTAKRAPQAEVHFLPFANQSEMPMRYALADLLVLPSEGYFETWGLAVNEAMHLGVPCVVSDRVGCRQDLIIHGETGWHFPAGDRAELSRVLNEALQHLSDPDAKRRLRHRINQKIGGYTYHQASQGLLQAMRLSAEEPG